MLRFFIAFLIFFTFVAYISVFVISLIIGEGLWLLGLGALLGFYFSWSIAGGVIFSPFSYFVLSDWNLFKKKLKYAISGSFIGFLIGVFAGYLFGYF